MLIEAVVDIQHVSVTHALLLHPISMFTYVNLIYTVRDHVQFLALFVKPGLNNGLWAE